MLKHSAIISTQEPGGLYHLHLHSFCPPLGSHSKCLYPFNPQSIGKHSQIGRGPYPPIKWDGICNLLLDLTLLFRQYKTGKLFPSWQTLSEGHQMLRTVVHDSQCVRIIGRHWPPTEDYRQPLRPVAELHSTIVTCKCIQYEEIAIYI